ncbi:MAG: Fe-S-containing hydro-lyase [Spirochaetaceae bacterium]|jgi:fumarate hydratase subunit beta|nr:Fe-S-containing hydro-lyase [Spirochaetaceae bacterium]
MEHHIRLPLTREKAGLITSGDIVYLSGDLYTARDAAHQRLIALLDQGASLPFPLEDQVIYYTGPTPAAPGQIIGSVGPTTSYRMDPYAPRLLERGLRGMIGKGNRSREVIATMQRSGAVYFGAIGGAGAMLSDCVKAAELIAFEDLGPEAIRRLTVQDFPAVAIIDTQGNNLYLSGPEAYHRWWKPSL